MSDVPVPSDAASGARPMAGPKSYAAHGAILLGGRRGDGGSIPATLALKFANRHGLVTGATGTGKTVTLQVLAEGFSAAGVAVFATDIKGDLAGIGIKGTPKPGLIARAAEIGIPGYDNAAFPVAYWDIFRAQGHPVRTSVEAMGPLLIARLLDLTEPQEGVLNIAFRWAADRRARDPNMTIRRLRDLRAVVEEMGRRAAELRGKFGNVAPATVGVLQRRLLVLEEQGADNFFGDPQLDIGDFMRVTPEGMGVVNILAADRLMNNPRLYAACLLWLLSELFDRLPEVGDLEKPKLVFLFDEAHLLFRDAPKAVLDQIERVTRLIRSKGVGVYYVTQSPADVPDRVSAQLGNRIQHALRAVTPKEQKAVRAAAQTLRKNPELDTETVIGQLQTGEALVSVLEDGGEPGMVERVLIRPPMARVGPLTVDERRGLVAADTAMVAKYAADCSVEGASERVAALHSAAGRIADTLEGAKATMGTWFGAKK